jgi:chitin disaccharide deacetylase
MRIVLNADDFGYSPDTVRTTIECFELGLLTSATIMPRMPATELALEFARTHPELSVGVHLTFTGDGVEQAVTEPGQIPDLVDKEGRFPATRSVRTRALLRRLPVEQIEQEMAAQIEVVRDAGVTVTHVDSHRHLHKFAPFRSALRLVLPHFGIRRVRAVQDVYLRRPLVSPTYWLSRSWRRRLRAEFATTDHFYMPTSAADTDWHRVSALLPVLAGKSLEIGVHPGREEEWRRREYESLAPFVEEAARRNELVGWGALPTS